MSQARPSLTTARLVCDFTSNSHRHRLKSGGGRGQALAKAIGMKGGKNPVVVDATAGLGRDAFLLAALGAEITLVERSPEMHALLSDGLDQARQSSDDLASIINRMTLIFGDAKDVLKDMSPDVVYMDPMHPERQKSALVKQEMRILRHIVGTDDDARELLLTALKTATNRVVLKWPRLADPMGSTPRPSHQIIGKSTRFDVFMTL